MFSSFMEYFRILPVEITLDILARLPTEAVLECKLVSKTWNNLVSHPSFSRIHFHHNPPSTAESGKLSVLALTGDAKFHYFDYTENHGSTPIVRIRRMNLPSPWESVRFVSSCNGLLCLSESPRSQVTIVICNPITREHVRLPQIKFDCDIDDVYGTSGFGYVSSTNEYKVVVIVSTTVVEVHIYTLGSVNGWRKLENLYEYLLDCIFHWDQGVFADGALYWKDIEPEMITAFELAEKEFDELLPPPPLPPEPESEWSDHKIW
ncbi:F-box protein At5g18160-like [Papaver somniferum]|uniref:F-box protein At5g18160-like n=1 Tax=Papaver somniferum TaxID=3469 RepID=UPI000E6F591F|nr:F-box protein At5g18160-like [Papaver somniferum]XP_026457629.1 F-box protein At5g18160-like [Papaver somniferum]XP_026457630.1 F-box protein At5g18160-like [Papaver somniferum]